MKNFNFEQLFNSTKTKDNQFIQPKIQRISQRKVYVIFKRFGDLFFSLIGMIVLIIPIIIISILVAISSPGPVFYVQERLGLNGREFKLIKFRTMYVDAEKDGAKWAEVNDSRITKIGIKLRKYRLDELPQLVNIFLGHISFVGPRPEREIFYDQFKEYIIGFDQRLLVKPGLSGFAQVNGGYDLKPEEKIIYDLFYIENRSILFDILILFKTFLVFFSHNGAR